MPVNPYDDRKVSLRRPHGNGDLDIVGASYARRKANRHGTVPNLSHDSYKKAHQCFGGISSKMNVPRIAAVELILILECRKLYLFI